MQVAPHGRFWWSDEKTEEDLLWGSWIEVSEAFYAAVMAFPTPLDIRVLRHVKDSALGIDLYAILNREAFRAMDSGRPRFLAWEWLHEQTGNEIANLRLFRRNALVQIEAILAVHSGLIISIVKGRKGQKSGMLISNLSTPSIPVEAPLKSFSEGKIMEVIEPSLANVDERHLRPLTLDTFRSRYPCLDPYACKLAFDSWLKGKRPEHQPKVYDSAFLGFAEKWVVGKR
jgi:Plasmid encoded RepA protein